MTQILLEDTARTSCSLAPSELQRSGSVQVCVRACVICDKLSPLDLQGQNLLIGRLWVDERALALLLTPLARITGKSPIFFSPSRL